MKKILKKFKKYFEFLYTKIKLLFQQKEYRSNGIALKYLFDRDKNSSALVVVFSACVREGLTARYNYVRTLKKVKGNKLFILDDFAEDKRGCYYLGEYPDWNIEKAVIALIESVKEKVNATTVIYCGSSKGGWAALNFGLACKPTDKDVIIAGAPQYYLGNYIRNFAPAFRFLKGNCSDDELVVKELNEHIQRKIQHKDKKEEIKIYLHYSSQEHTYSEHIQGLLSDLHENGYAVAEDRKEYVDHSEVALWFPQFLTGSIEKELQ
jgi:hypothetical protein